MDQIEKQLIEIKEHLRNINQEIEKMKDDLTQIKETRRSSFSNILNNILKGIIIVIFIFLIISALPLFKLAFS